MAAVRPRRHDPLLRPAPPRSGDDQVHAAEDHRPGHRLAVSERAEEGVEGMKRREFLRGAVIAGMAGVLPPIRGDAAEPPPETTRLRLTKVKSICVAPEYAAEELLRAEGFTDVEYVQKAGTVGKEKGLAAGDIDLTLHFVAPLVVRLDAGDPLVILAGVHSGCFELFGTERVRAIRDLKGKTVALAGLGTGSTQHIFLALTLAYVGVDPAKDVRWVTHPVAEAMQLLAERKVDACLG